MSIESESKPMGELIDEKPSTEVFRKTDEFPAGLDCDLSVDDIPSSEDGFYQPEHYEERRDKRQRPRVTNAVVDYLLNNGVVKRVDGDWENPRYLVQAELSEYWSLDRAERVDRSITDCRQFEWTVVIADDRNDDQIEDDFALITVFSNYHGSIGTTNRYFDRKRNQ